MPHRRLPAVFRVASSPLQAPRRFRNPENRPGRVSIPNSSPFSRSTRFPFTSTPSPPAPLAIGKAPSASVESIEPRPPRPCEVGRPKGRRRKNRRQSHTFFFSTCCAWHTNSPPRPGEAPHPAPSARKSATRTAQKTALCAPCEHPGGSESENRPATRGTAHSEVQGDARCTARCNVRPIAALHFLLPTGDSRSGRRSLIPNSSPFSRSTRFPFVHRFAARAPCDSQGSECQCGIHTAEAASALRSRKTERAAKEKPTPISQFFFSAAAARLPPPHARQPTTPPDHPHA